VPQPHVCLDETPNYLFPPLPEKKKSPGETWRFRVPLIIPLPQGIPPRIYPTMFMAVVDCRLCEVRESGNSKFAVIEYRVSGLFDSSLEEFAGTCPEELKIIHRISGAGVLHLDVEKGRILEKSETLNVFLYSAGSVKEPGKPAKVQESQADITSSYQIKLMLPGMKLKNNVVVPSYD
jgi:hypothetical protein